MVSVKVVGAIVIVAVLAFAAGFFTQPLIFPPTKELRPVLVRLDYLTGGKHVGYFVALEKGYYAENGMQVTIERGFGSADTVKAVDAGKATFGMADISTLILGREGGLKVKEVAMIYASHTMTVDSYATENVKALKDLEGKSVCNEPGSSNYALTPGFLKINNVDYDKVIWVEVGIGLGVPTMLEEKCMHRFGYWASDSTVLEVQANRAGKQVTHLFWDELGMPSYTNGIIASDDMIENEPDFVKAFVTATMRGYKYSIEHPNEGLDILIKYHPEIDREITELQIEQILESIQSPEALENGLGYMSLDKVQKTVDTVREAFGKSVPVEDVYTSEFIEKI